MGRRLTEEQIRERVVDRQGQSFVTACWVYAMSQDEAIEMIARFWAEAETEDARIEAGCAAAGAE